MATKYYVDTTFEEEEEPSSTKLTQFNERVKAGFQLVSNALVDMTGDDTVIDDVGRLTELKVTASSPADMTVHVDIGVACVDGQICQVDAPVEKTIVAPTSNPRYTIIQVDEEGNVETVDGTEAASPVEPDAEADAMKIAAIYLPANTTQIDDSDLGYGYIIDRRQWPTINLGSGNVGIGTTGPDAKLDVLDTTGPQLRLTYEDGVKFVDFELDTNHDLTIKPSSTGQIKFQPTTDSTDFLQVLDSGGGTPILNIDTVSELVGIKKDNPVYALDIAGKVKIDETLGIGIAPSDSVAVSAVMAGAGITNVLRLCNTQAIAADVGVRIMLNAGPGLSSLAYIDGAFEGVTNDDGYLSFSTRKTDALGERVRISSDGFVGINTIGPDRRLEVLDSSNPQLRLTHTDGSVYTDFQTSALGNLYINPSGRKVALYDGTNSFELDLYNGSTTKIILTADGNSFFNAGSVGIGTIGPDRRLEVLDSSNPQLRLTHTADSVYTDLQTDTNGDLTITPSGGNAIISGDISATGGFKQPFSFMQSDVAASQSAVAIPVLGLNGNTELVMPYAGSVIGISIASNAARSAGTLIVDVSVNGTVTGLQAQLDGTNPQYDSGSQVKDTDTFAAGDRLGVKITTDSSWAPTTADIVVSVIVEM